MRVATVEQMRNMDSRAIQKYCLPETVLMENAGLASISVIQNELEIGENRFIVLCGLGNNGGDGLVVARKLHSNGGEVKVVVLGNPQKYKGASADNFDRAKKGGVEIIESPEGDTLNDLLTHSDVVIDGLFGTGLTRDVGGRYKDVVEAINKYGKQVFSLDIPSGVDGNNGQIRGVAVKADHTITFGLPKLGNLLFPGASCGGMLWVTHISFPPALYEDDAIKISLIKPRPLPQRSSYGHKGSFGDVLFIAGAAGYLGAPSFSSLSFLKAGGGYSRLAAPKSIVPHVAGVAGEVVFLPQEETAEGTLSSSCLPGLLEWCKKADMAVVGPGLSVNKETQSMIRELIAEAECPLLLDGDGLTAAATNLNIIRDRKAPTILTPHPGEMARLCGCTIKYVQENAVNTLRSACADLGAQIVLKGAHSLIGLPDKRMFINVTGNSGMASAGSGDVLAGTIAAMYGLGLPVADALINGVFLHGMAGDFAALYQGTDGITARDIMEALPETIESFREDYSNIVSSHYGAVRVIL